MNSIDHEMINSDDFNKLGHHLIDVIANEMNIRENYPLTCHLVPSNILNNLQNSNVPELPRPHEDVLAEAIQLMYGYSLFTSHPKFLGYVCPAVDPMGILAETLVAAVNPNAASAMMTPIGFALEKTVVKWLSQIVGFSKDSGGILVSGGNTANLMGVLCARQSKAPWPIREHGFNHVDARPLYIYATAEAHGGIGRAVEIAGLGRESLRIVATDDNCRMDVDDLKRKIDKDRHNGAFPICIVATIGTVGTGAIDPLIEVAEVARKENIWLHVDGSYGAAMALADHPPVEFSAMNFVDSLSWDPHKWLRVPIEAGCILLKDPNALANTFGNRPGYYTFGPYIDTTHYYEQGIQNTRHLHALKTWISLQEHGTQGHGKYIMRDLDLNKRFYNEMANFHKLERRSCNLCVSTFRYLSPDMNLDQYALNKLNAQILNDIQSSGKLYLSNAIVNGDFLLRACFINYQTEIKDLKEILEIVINFGDELAKEI